MEEQRHFGGIMLPPDEFLVTGQDCWQRLRPEHLAIALPDSAVSTREDMSAKH